MAEAAAELIGAGASRPAAKDIDGMIDWFRDHAAPGFERAIAARREA